MATPPVDPILCCAARVCCHGVKALKATETLLQKMGMDASKAEKAAMWMEANDIVFMPRIMSMAMRDLISSSHDFQQDKDNGKHEGGIDL